MEREILYVDDFQEVVELVKEFMEGLEDPHVIINSAMSDKFRITNSEL